MSNKKTIVNGLEEKIESCFYSCDDCKRRSSPCIIYKACAYIVMLEKLAKTHLAMYTDKDGKLHYPSYKTYAEETKQHTSANLISEKEYNKIIWELENGK
jgi:hypothetical protein